MRKDNEQYISKGAPAETGCGIPVLTVVEQLNTIAELEAPQNKKQKKALGKVLEGASIESPIAIYVGSCPDYSHENGLYTHQSVGENVPLLTQVHLGVDLEVVRTLEAASIPYEYVIMVADVEATDEIFCDKFAGGDQPEFLRRCMSSAHSTQEVLDQVKNANMLSGTLRSSSFFTEFGYQEFLDTQHAYESVLRQRYQEDSSFRARVDTDIVTRRQMYERMYDKVLRANHIDYHQFLVGRDIRTKAQYLTLGRLIGSASENAIIINHPTTNIGMFNDRNRYTLPGDGSRPQRTIPVFEMKTRVY
ncbi:hypothetical protein C4564_05925 [Candidatus Microgenomates bacterium]|nr:MAG: hypothetical protein C4564_05925 [Candidatus Microgenomates bacterium]